MLNPKLPSLGPYAKLIKTPEKQPIQKKHEYTLSVPKERDLDNGEEEGEIIEDSDSNAEMDENIESIDHEDKTIEPMIEVAIDDDNKIIRASQKTDQEYQGKEVEEKNEEVNMTGFEDAEDSLMDYAKPLSEIVKIPQQLLEPVEQTIDRESNKEKDIENADKQIENLEQLIKEHLEKRTEEELSAAEALPGTVLEPKVTFR